ncbi:type V CRISPR-associated protein Cas12k [Synechocystis sp. CACIAM 05]|uniref:type V CRISPR-associated protein Cas12k n=1 Tax=Synechocystis sp. CACIAM 05 TaxID=1933929 RepID=UPI00138E7A63|nr:type V CRISPR-associated protein Cas12k [Synechocystis sp. CACIAM 05]QHU98937.1 hypothetical protein BWK47_01515 [Synechocystis sp. CACIAM 05]
MSIITIHCNLTAPESTRKQLWELMAQKNTPLINELLRLLAVQDDFEVWCQQGYPPAGLVKRLCDQLKTQDPFKGQPSRFYSSAISQVEYTYKSYLRLQRQLRQRLQGQERWLEILKSDAQLSELTGVSLETIQNKAQQILTQLSSSSNLRQQLFTDYDKTTSPLKQAAISYLLKNGCRIPQKSETPEKFKLRLGKAQHKVKQLREQINANLPLGRDLNDHHRLALLELMDKAVPETNTQAKSWQDQLLKDKASVPYAITYGTNEDLSWGKNDKGRLTVKLSGLGEMTFNIYCDQRQLKWFKRFYEDQQTKRKSKNQHSSALFTLRSAMLGWRQHGDKGNPWNRNRLTFFCSLETRLWSQEGTEIVRQEKATEVAKVLTSMQEKSNLSPNQQAFIKRKESTLARLNNPFPRPSKKVYQGLSNVLVAVSMTLSAPATVAVVDATTQQVIAKHSFKQLLGKDYPLYNRQQKQKQKLAHGRKQAQVRHQTIQAKELELGQQIDRIIAKSIVNLAMSYKAGSIVLPALTAIRSSLQAEVNAKAEAKIPGCLEAQKAYAKQYRTSVNSWSYGRLQNCIAGKASQHEIEIEYIELPAYKDPSIMAEEMAFTAYKQRQVP